MYYFESSIEIRLQQYFVLPERTSSQKLCFICGSVRNLLDRFYGPVDMNSLSSKLFFVFQGAAPEKQMNYQRGFKMLVDIAMSTASVRNLHMICSYVSAWTGRGIATVISIYGVYALIKRNFISYIPLVFHYMPTVEELSLCYSNGCGMA